MDKAYAIFDMDGTLVDSLPMWRNLATDYLGQKGLTPTRELLEAIRPMTLSQSAELFRQTFGLSGDPEAEMTAMIHDAYHSTIPLLPGVRAYLEELRCRGVRMCVASATAKPLMEACLTRLGVRDCFAFLLSCEEVGRGKDSPAVYLEAARRLGAKPEEIAVFEDDPMALETARRAGFNPISADMIQKEAKL